MQVYNATDDQELTPSAQMKEGNPLPSDNLQGQRRRRYEEIRTQLEEADTAYEREIEKYYAEMGLPYEPPKPMAPEELTQYL